MSINQYLPEKTEILSINKESQIDYTYRIKCDMDLIGGQFLQVSIPGFGEAPISVSDFGEGYADLTIRNVGRLTSVISSLKKGDILHIRGPYGNGFPIDEYKNKHLIISAGGTGLAPVKNVVNYFYDHIEMLKGFDLLLGFKTPSDILFNEEIEKWQKKINLTLTVDNPNETWQGKSGLITEYVAGLNINDKENYAVVIVGPPLMMKFTSLEFIKNGISEDDIWLSFERKMSCGIGKCGHCKIDSTYICLEGPVFKYPEAKKLVD